MSGAQYDESTHQKQPNQLLWSSWSWRANSLQSTVETYSVASGNNLEKILTSLSKHELHSYMLLIGYLFSVLTFVCQDLQFYSPVVDGREGLRSALSALFAFILQPTFLCNSMAMVTCCWQHFLKKYCVIATSLWAGSAFACQQWNVVEPATLLLRRLPSNFPSQMLTQTTIQFVSRLEGQYVNYEVMMGVASLHLLKS